MQESKMEALSMSSRFVSCFYLMLNVTCTSTSALAAIVLVDQTQILSTPHSPTPAMR